MSKLLVCSLLGICIICSMHSVIAQEVLTLSGTHFTQTGQLPKLYTCDSSGISPALMWNHIPTDTKSFAITMYHIAKDGERHVYMVLYNIPASTTSIPDGVTNVGVFGSNSMNRIPAYAPPCSKGPGPKEYIITINALSQMYPVESSAALSLSQLEAWMEAKIVSRAKLSAIYSRSAK
ncbi:MAG: YbhB/YbcL family Raf kinase inhibitor-like protein [Chitinophagia bacterium]|nr:YbhB/YbcL family Raf kinase inhibitor-like protein [Chitinophagia bacterium]